MYVSQAVIQGLVDNLLELRRMPRRCKQLCNVVRIFDESGNRLDAARVMATLPRQSGNKREKTNAALHQLYAAGLEVAEHI